MVKDINNVNKKPVKVYKAGLLSLSLWENETKEGIMKSFTIQRSYKDSEEKWQHTQNLRISDLLKLGILLEEAYRDTMLNEVISG